MELKDFLVEVNKHGYANPDAEFTKLPDGSREFVFKSGLWGYRDKYYSSNPFLGEEVVWHNGNVFWGMNYCGNVFAVTVSPKVVGEFLKDALRHMPLDKPFRGPEKFVSGRFEYRNSVEGDLNFFSGREAIFFDGDEVYRLFYHGGRI